MSRYTPSTNPHDVVADLVPHDSGAIIYAYGEIYDDIGLKYTNPPPSTQTNIILVPPRGTKTVESIETTKVGERDVNPAWKWYHDEATNQYRYVVNAAYLSERNFAINFTVYWTDGKRHDPKIVINPT